MNQLPDEKELAELVEIARVATEKAKAMYMTADTIAKKWERRLADKQNEKEKQGA
ncbi:hypothetical protein [Chroococcidiopsis sp.]|uniref:hypothetical protein n=1 Tax=Chroococcidiopsis sp. TaxID=3088168 RepID=UPI003F3C01C5